MLVECRSPKPDVQWYFSSGRPVVVWESICFFLMFASLVMKNSLKLFANSWLVYPGGRGRSLSLLSRFSQMASTCLVLYLFSQS